MVKCSAFISSMLMRAFHSFCDHDPPVDICWQVLPHPLVNASVGMHKSIGDKIRDFSLKIIKFLSTRKVCLLHPCLNVLWGDSISKVLMPGFANAASIKLEVVLAVVSNINFARSMMVISLLPATCLH